MAKKSHTLNSYSESFVREAIRAIVVRSQSGIPLASHEMLYARLEERMKSEIAYSASRKWSEEDNPGHAALILHPHFLGKSISWRKRKRAIERSREGLRSFLYEYLPMIERWPSSEVGSSEDLALVRFDGFSVFAPVDLTLIQGVDLEERLLISWRLDGLVSRDRLEIMAAHTAMRSDKGVLSSNIVAYSVPLLNVELERVVEMSSETTARAQAKMRSDISRLKKLHPFGMDGDEEAFPAILNEECSGCPFYFRCHEDLVAPELT